MSEPTNIMTVGNFSAKKELTMEELLRRLELYEKVLDAQIKDIITSVSGKADRDEILPSVFK